MLALKKNEDDCYHCPVINSNHPGFTSKQGCRKHVNNIHPWYFYFDENPGRDISDETHQHLVLKILKRNHALFTCLLIL